MLITHNYYCKKCDTVHDYLHRRSDDSQLPPKCENCGSKAIEQRFSSPHCKEDLLGSGLDAMDAPIYRDFNKKYKKLANKVKSVVTR